jgi:hypothetical protein
MTSAYPAGHHHRPTHPVHDAVRRGDYERAALRLLYGFLAALDETAPAAREECLGLIVERRLDTPADRGRTGGHR